MSDSPDDRAGGNEGLKLIEDDDDDEEREKSLYELENSRKTSKNVYRTHSSVLLNVYHRAVARGRGLERRG